MMVFNVKKLHYYSFNMLTIYTITLKQLYLNLGIQNHEKYVLMYYMNWNVMDSKIHDRYWDLSISFDLENVSKLYKNNLCDKNMGLLLSTSN